ESGEEQSNVERKADAKTHDQPRGEADRHRAHDQVSRQEPESDLKRAIAEHELQVERREKEPRKHRACPKDANGVRDGDVAKSEEAERDEWRARGRHDPKKDGKGSRRG